MVLICSRVSYSSMFIIHDNLPIITYNYTVIVGCHASREDFPLRLPANGWSLLERRGTQGGGHGWREQNRFFNFVNLIFQRL